MPKHTSTLLAISILVLVGCVSPGGDVRSDGTLSAREAGSIFGEICIELWPDLDAAQSEAQRSEGLQFSATSGLFEHPERELQMRINIDRCAIRYLTDTPRTDILGSFAEASSPINNTARRARANGENFELAAEDEGNGLIRAAAFRDK